MRCPPRHPTAGRYHVCDLAVDVRQRTLRRPEGDLELTTRVFDLLRVLLDEPNVLHTRESLFERVWGTTCLEDGNLTQCISVLRKALGESRKDWIRTQAKRGYSFEPPGSVRFVADADTTIALADAAPPSFDIARVAASPQHRPAASAARSIRARAAILALIALVLSLPGALRTPPSSAQTPMSGAGIAVIVVGNEAREGDARVATRLSAEWLRWKLGWLPEVTLIDAQQPLSARRVPTYIVNLSVTAAPHRRDRYLVDIDLRPVYGSLPGPVAPMRRTLTFDTDTARLPGAIDAASRIVYNRLLPQRKRDRWPRLTLDMRQADTYLQALDAERRHDAARADALLSGLMRQAPEFAPALWRLAHRRADIGKRREAGELAHLARLRSAPMPGDAGRLFAAAEDALALKRPEDTARTYAHLYRANPERIDFLLMQARLLLRAYRPEPAMRMLSGAEWERQPIDVRIRQRVARAETALMLGYLDTTRESANDAIALIAQTDGGWTHELGTAQLLVARARHKQFRQSVEPALYRRAIRTFADGGYTQDMRIATYLEAAAREDTPAAAALLQPALTTVRANGDPSVELMLLRSMAEQYASVDLRAQAEALRREAYLIAGRNGEIAMREVLELDLLFAALDDGDVREASERLSRLHADRLWGKYRFRAARAESILYSLLGRHRDALAALDRPLNGPERLDAYDAAPVESAKIACTRVEVLIALDEIEMARAQLPACRDIGSGSVPLWAESSRAEIAYRTGDASAARAHVDTMLRMLAQRRRDDISTSFHITAASLLTRLGDDARAERIYLDIAGDARRQGYPLSIAHIELGLAEIAAVRRQWNDSARHAAAVRALFPQPMWQLDSRLRLLDIARLHAQGDTKAARSRAEMLTGQARARGDAMIARQSYALSSSQRTVVGRQERSPMRERDERDERTIAWLVGPATGIAIPTMDTSMTARAR